MRLGNDVGGIRIDIVNRQLAPRRLPATLRYALVEATHMEALMKDPFQIYAGYCS